MTPTSVFAWTAVGAAAGLLMTPLTFCLVNSYVKRSGCRILLAAITAVAFSVIALHYSTLTELVAYSIVAAAGVQLATIDSLTRTLPRVVIWPTLIMVSCLFVSSAIINDDGPRLLRAVAGAAIFATGYLVIALASRGGLGPGDIRAAALVGCMLGWHSWSAILIGMTLPFLATSTLFALSSAGQSTRHQVPHGPGLFAGALAAMCI